MTRSSKPLGGVIHTYQRYDPKNLPSPTQTSPVLVSPAPVHAVVAGAGRCLGDTPLLRSVLRTQQLEGRVA